MTFKKYKTIYGEDGYCSLTELEYIRENSNPRSYRAIENHWRKAHYKMLEKLAKEGEQNA